MIVEGYNLKSIKDYLKYIRTNFRKDTNIRPGWFYSYHYNFSKYYPIEELKFYDYEPLIFCFERYKNYAVGINFHHMPPKPRVMWFNRVLKMSKELNSLIKITDFKNRPVYRIKGLNYPKVYQILRKSQIAIRLYRLDRVTQLRAVDIRKFEEISSFFANTYYDINVGQISTRYSQYRPR